MRKSTASIILSFANWLELFISFIMMVILIFLSFRFMLDVLAVSDMQGAASLTEFLEMAINIAVGVEFVKMLCKHTPETIIEVLLFATARQMIVYHNSALDTLIGVVCIAGLFATKKHFFCAFDTTEEAVFRAAQKAKIINWLYHINIPSEDGDTLGDVVVNRLIKEDKEIATGSCVYYHDFALRIAKMHGDVITRVEVIRSL
ncbi:MAG: transporter associated domain-containing protein [Lachnospiraceae bacterium]